MITKTNISKELQQKMTMMDCNSDTETNAVVSSSKKKLRKRYNKIAIIDLEKRAILRNLIKQNSLCEHKQIYTQANAICRRISSSYEEGKISAHQALELMIEAHNQMSHHGLPKDVVADEMKKRLNKLEKGENVIFETPMANVSYADNLKDKKNGKDISDQDSSNRYSESYWAEVI